MIHKMAALSEYFDSELIESMNNKYGLHSQPMDKRVICLNFQLNLDSVSLGDIELVQYDTVKNLTHFFFKPVSANSVSPFPTVYLNDEMLRDKEGEYSSGSKFMSKIIRILKACCSLNPQLQPIMDFFENSHESVLEKITEVTKDNPKELYIFTLKINNKFIGKSELFDIVRETASEEIYSSYYTQDKKVIEGLNSTCSICRQQNKTVWGYVSTYNFYTSKTEFAPIAGGFKKEKAHLNYPVCPECAQKLESFKPVIEKYFRFKFCGLDYFLIPEFIIQDKSNDSLQNVLTVFTELDNENSTRLGKLSLGKDKPILEGAKNEVFNYLASAKNSANYTMLFFVENNAEFKVLMTVENVFPSQFNEILNAKTSADSHSVFHNLRGVIKDTEANLEFKFELLKEFFPINSKIYGDFTKSFLEIVRAVFIQKKLSYPFILDRIMKVVRTRFVRDEYWEISVRKSLLTMEFLLELGIIEIKKGNFKEVELNSKYESFFDEHCDVFTSNATKAVFLIGVLCQFLLNIQQNDRHAQPFRKKLNSLKMSPVLIRKIYPEIIEKLEQYGKNYYRELEGDISNLLVKEKLEILTNDEISFYFVMGMTLSKDFKLTKNNEEGEENA